MFSLDDLESRNGRGFGLGSCADVLELVREELPVIFPVSNVGRFAAGGPNLSEPGGDITPASGSPLLFPASFSRALLLFSSILHSCSTERTPMPVPWLMSELLPVAIMSQKRLPAV